jgi:histidinol-phosphate/aromatic aminotransferase/cobyric acid decarboxylase-like protein
VMVACSGPQARRLAEEAAAELAVRRRFLVDQLAGLDLSVVPGAEAPFVLVDTRGWVPGRASGWVRAALREQGIAVRRGDTFPGLDADWIRIAVRDEDTTGSLIKALTVIAETRG